MEIPRLLLLLVLQIVLIAINAYFAGTELALVSVSEIRLKALADEGDKRAKKLLKLTGKPEKFLSTIQIAITLAGFLGSALAADSFAEPLQTWLADRGVLVAEIPHRFVDAFRSGKRLCGNVAFAVLLLVRHAVFRVRGGGGLQHGRCVLLARKRRAA